MPKARSERPSKAPTRPLEDKNDKRDILISIKTPHMNNIVSRVKDHEFRKYLISRTVERMWYASCYRALSAPTMHLRLYVSSPDQTLRYIAIISQGKAPGDIENEQGLGNADFNGGRESGIGVASHAYEIIHLYKLKRPLHISVLSERYKISPPQRYAYTPRQLSDDVKLEDQEMLF
ncbi:hypothetical protein C8R46DRAFT_1293573 [Mycena filopes]|nr:hypothetical protein C8R46DRAFT_1293573 [Mycena filopes]